VFQGVLYAAYFLRLFLFLHILPSLVNVFSFCLRASSVPSVKFSSGHTLSFLLPPESGRLTVTRFAIVCTNQGDFDISDFLCVST
jgi:hypothetical protein